MNEQIRSGHDILIEFFSEIEKIDGIEQDVARTIRKLYFEDKLTNINISNELSKIRKGKQND